MHRGQGSEQRLVCELKLDKTTGATERMRGLLGRKGLSAAQGLWIEPCNSVHTFFMAFAIDVLYLDRELRVKRTCAELKPWRGSACFTARSVIELAAGEMQRLGIAEGDQIQWSAGHE